MMSENLCVQLIIGAYTFFNCSMEYEEFCWERNSDKNIITLISFEEQTIHNYNIAHRNEIAATKSIMKVNRLRKAVSIRRLANCELGVDV